MWKFTQHSFAGGVQDTRLIGRQDLDRYWISAKTLDNFLVQRQGCIQKRRGTDFVADIAVPSGSAVRLIPFVFERNAGYVLAFVAGASGGSVYVLSIAKGCADSVAVLTGLPYRAADLDTLSYVQSGDVIILAHRNHPPARITRKSDGTFVYDAIDFKNLGGNPLPDPPHIKVTKGSNSGTGNERTVTYAATAVGTDGRESELGEAVPMSYKLPWANTFVVNIDIDGVTGDTLPEGVSHYNIYKKTSNGFGIIGSTKGQKGERQVQQTDANGNPVVDENGDPVMVTEVYNKLTTFQDDNIIPDTSMTPPVVKDFFKTEYPASVALVDQRLVFAATDGSPYTVWWSTVGDLYNFNEHESVRDDDGFSANIPATELPRINHIVAMRTMLIFSDGAEWTAEPVSGEALTLKSLSFKQQSQVGCSDTLRPTIIEDKVVFADSTCETVRTIDYSYERDGYTTQNLTILSQSLFDNNPIRRWTYAQHPDSTLWCVLEDGTLATLAYMQEHELVAWSHQRLGGSLRAMDIVCTKEVSSGCSALLILAVDPDGNYKLLRVRDETDIPTIEASVCLDGMRLETEPRDLDMEEVAVDAETGRVCHAMRSGRAYYVGYPYPAVLRTISPEAKGESTIQFELKDAISAEIRAGNSTPFAIVPTALEDDPGQAVEVDNLSITDGELDLSPRDCRIELAGHSGTDGAVTLVCEAPFPFQLLSYSINYELDPQTIGVQ